PPSKPKPVEPPMSMPDPEPKPNEMDASQSPVPDMSGANVRVASSPAIADFLTDENGRALYMYVGDIGSNPDSSCLDACAEAWPPFDVLSPQPSAALDKADVSRFHRYDGLWQTRYRGFPLYYRASESGSGTTDV